MTVKQFKKLINSIPESLDDNIIVLPEGYHSSQNINWCLDQKEVENPVVIISCS